MCRNLTEKIQNTAGHTDGLGNYILIQQDPAASFKSYQQEKLYPAFINYSSFYFLPVFIKMLNILTNLAHCIMFEKICTPEMTLYRASTITVPLSLLTLNRHNAPSTQPPPVIAQMLPECVDLSTNPYVAEIRKIKDKEFVGEIYVENSYLANPAYTVLLDLINFNIYYLRRIHALTNQFISNYAYGREPITELSPLDTRVVKASWGTYIVESNLIDQHAIETCNKFASIHTEELAQDTILPLSLPMQYDVVLPVKRTTALPAALQRLLTEQQWEYKHILLTTLHRQCSITKTSLGTISFAYKESESEHVILKCRTTSPITLCSHYDGPMFQFFVRSAATGASFFRFFRGTKAESSGIVTHTERYGPRQTLAADRRWYNEQLKRLGFPIMTLTTICIHLFPSKPFVFGMLPRDDIDTVDLPVQRAASGLLARRVQTAQGSRFANPILTKMIPNCTSSFSEFGLFGANRPSTHGGPSPLPAHRMSVGSLSRDDQSPQNMQATNSTHPPEDCTILPTALPVVSTKQACAFDSPVLLTSPRFCVSYTALQVTFLNLICKFIDAVPLSISAVKTGKESVGVILHAFNSLFSALHARYCDIGYSFITVKKRIFFLLKSFSTETFSLIDYYTHHYHIEKGLPSSVLDFLMNASTKRMLQRDYLPNIYAYIHLYIKKEIHLEDQNKYYRLDKISDDDDAEENGRLFMRKFKGPGKKGLVNCYLGDPSDLLGEDGQLKPAEEEDEASEEERPAYVCSDRVLTLEKIEIDEASPMLHFAMLYIRLFGLFSRELTPIICSLFARDCILNGVYLDNELLQRNPILCYKLFCRVVISKFQEAYLQDLNEWIEYICPQSHGTIGAPQPELSRPSSVAQVESSVPHLVLDLEQSAPDGTSTISAATAVADSIITRRFLSQGFFTTADRQEMDFLHFEFNCQQISKDNKRYVTGEDAEGLSNLKIIYANSLDFELSQFRTLIAAIFTSVMELKCNIEQHLEFDLLFLSRSVVPGFDSMLSLQGYVMQQVQKEMELIQESLTDNILNPQTFRDDIKRAEYLTEISSSRVPDFITSYYSMRKEMRIQYSKLLMANMQELTRVKETYGLSMKKLNESLHNRRAFDRSILLPERATFVAFERLLSSISSVSQLCLAFIEQEFGTSTLHTSAKNLVFSLCFDPLQEVEQLKAPSEGSRGKKEISIIHPPKFLLNSEDNSSILLDFESLLGLDTALEQRNSAKGGGHGRAIGGMSLPIGAKMSRHEDSLSGANVANVTSLLDHSKALELIENAIVVTQDIIIYIKNNLLPLPDVLYTKFATYTIRILKNQAINKLLSLVRKIRQHVQETIHAVMKEASQRIQTFKESLIVDVDTPDNLELVLQSKNAAQRFLTIWMPAVSICLLALPKISYLESYRHVNSIQSINNSLETGLHPESASPERQQVASQPPDIYTLLESDVSFDQKMDHTFDAQFWMRCKRDIEVYESAKQQEMQRQIEKQQSLIRQQEQERREMIKKLARDGIGVADEDPACLQSLHNEFVSEKGLLSVKKIPLSRKYLSTEVKSHSIRLQPILRKQSALVSYRQELLTIDLCDYKFNILDFVQLLASVKVLMRRADRNIQSKICPFSRYIYLSVEYLMYLRTVCTNYAVEVCYMTAADLILSVRNPSQFRIKYPYMTDNLILKQIDPYFASENIDASYTYLNFLQRSTSLAITRYASERALSLSTFYTRPGESDLIGVDSVVTFDDFLAFIIQRVSAHDSMRGYNTSTRSIERVDTYYNVYHIFSDISHVATESQKIYNSLEKWATLVGIKLSISKPTFLEITTSLKHPVSFFLSLINVYATYTQSLKASISLFNYKSFDKYSEELYLAAREMHLADKQRVKCAHEKSESRNVKSSSFFIEALDKQSSSTTHKAHRSDGGRKPSLAESVLRGQAMTTASAASVSRYLDSTIVLDGSAATSLPMSSKLESNASDTLLTLIDSAHELPPKSAQSQGLGSVTLVVSRLREHYYELPDPCSEPSSSLSVSSTTAKQTDSKDDSESEIVAVITKDQLQNDRWAPSKLLMTQLANDLDLEDHKDVLSYDDIDDAAKVQDQISRSSNTDSEYSDQKQHDEKLDIGLLRMRRQEPGGIATSYSTAQIRLNKAVAERIKLQTANARPVAAIKIVSDVCTDRQLPSSSDTVSPESHLTDVNFRLETSSSVADTKNTQLKRRPKLSINTQVDEEKLEPSIESVESIDPELLSRRIQEIIADYCRKNEQPPFVVQYSSWIEIADRVVQVHLLAVTQRIIFLSEIRRLFTSRCFVERLFTMLDKSCGDISATNAKALLKATTVDDMTRLLNAQNFTLITNMTRQYELNLVAEKKLHEVYRWILSIKVWIVKYSFDIPLHTEFKTYVSAKLGRSQTQTHTKRLYSSTMSKALRRPASSAIEGTSPASYQLLTRIDQTRRPITIADVDCSLYCPITLDYSTKFRRKYINRHRPTKILLFDRLEPLIDLFREQSMEYDTVYQKARAPYKESLPKDTSMSSVSIISDDSSSNETSMGATRTASRNVSGSRKRTASARRRPMQSYEAQETIELPYLSLQPYLLKALREALFVVSSVLGDDQVVESVKLMARRLHIMLSAVRVFVAVVEKIRLRLPEMLALLNIIFDEIPEISFLSIDVECYKGVVATLLQTLHLFSDICVAMHEPDKKIDFGKFSSPSFEHLKAVSLVRNKRLDIPRFEFISLLSDLADDTADFSAQTKHARLASYLDGDSTCMPLAFFFEQQQYSLVEAFIAAANRCDGLLQEAKQLFREKSIGHMVAGRLDLGLEHLPELFYITFSKFNGPFINSQFSDQCFGAMHTGSEVKPPLLVHGYTMLSGVLQPHSCREARSQTVRHRGGPHMSARSALPASQVTADVLGKLKYAYLSGHIVANKFLYSKGGTQVSFFGLQSGHETVLYDKVINLRCRLRMVSVLFHPKILASALQAEFRKAIILMLNEQYFQLLCYCPYQAATYALSACVLIYLDGRYESFDYCYYHVLDRLKRIIECSHSEIIAQMGNANASIFSNATDADTVVTRLFTLKAIYARIIELMSLLDIIALSVISHIFSLNPLYQSQFQKLEPPFVLRNYSKLLAKFSRSTALSERSKQQGISLSFVHNKFTSSLFLCLPTLKLLQKTQCNYDAARADEKTLVTEAYRRAAIALRRAAPLRSQLEAQNASQGFSDVMAVSNIQTINSSDSATDDDSGTTQDDTPNKAMATFSLAEIACVSPSAAYFPPAASSFATAPRISRDEGEALSIDPLPRPVPNDIVRVDADAHDEIDIPLDAPPPLTSILLGPWGLKNFDLVYMPCCTQYDTAFIDYTHKRKCTLLISSLVDHVPVIIFTDKHMGYRSMEVLYLIEHATRLSGLRYCFLNVALGQPERHRMMVYANMLSGVTTVLTGLELISAEDREKWAAISALFSLSSGTDFPPIYDRISASLIDAQTFHKLRHTPRPGGVVFWIADATCLDSAEGQSYVVSDWSVEFLRFFRQKTQLYFPTSYITNDCHALAMDYAIDMPTYIQRISFIKNQFNASIFDLISTKTGTPGSLSAKASTSLAGSIVSSRMAIRTATYTASHRLPRIFNDLHIISDSCASCTLETLFCIIPQYASQIAMFTEFLLRQTDDFPKLVLGDIRTVIQTLQSPITVLNVCLALLFYLAVLMRTEESEPNNFHARQMYLVEYLATLFNLETHERSRFKSLAESSFSKFEQVIRVYASDTYVSQLNILAQSSGLLSLFGAHSLFTLGRILATGRPCILLLDSMDPGTLTRIRAGIEHVSRLHVLLVYSIYDLFEVTESVERSADDIGLMLICADPADTYWIGTIFAMCSYRQEICLPNRVKYVFPRLCKAIVVAHPKCLSLMKISCPIIYFNRNVHLSPLGLLQVSFSSVAFLNMKYFTDIRSIGTSHLSTYKDVIEYIAMKYDVDYHLYTHAEQTRIKQDVYLNYLNFFYYNITILASRRVFSEYTFSLRDWRVIKALITLFLAYDNVLNIKHYMDVVDGDDYRLFIGSATKAHTSTTSAGPRALEQSSMTQQIAQTIANVLPQKRVSDLNPYAELAYFSYHDQEVNRSEKNEIEYIQECRKNIDMSAASSLSPRYVTGSPIYLPWSVNFSRKMQIICEFSYPFTKLIFVNTSTAEVISRIHSSIFPAIFNAFTLLITAPYKARRVDHGGASYCSYYRRYLRLLPSFLHLVHKFFCPAYLFRSDPSMQQWFASFYASLKANLQDLYAVQLSMHSFISREKYCRYTCLTNTRNMSDAALLRAAKFLDIERQLPSNLAEYLQAFNSECEQLDKEAQEGIWIPGERSPLPTKYDKLSLSQLDEASSNMAETSSTVLATDMPVSEKSQCTPTDSDSAHGQAPQTDNVLLRRFADKVYVHEVFGSYHELGHDKALGETVHLPAASGLRRELPSDLQLSAHSIHLESATSTPLTDSAPSGDMPRVTEKQHELEHSASGHDPTTPSDARPGSSGEGDYIEFVRQTYQLVPVPYHMEDGMFSNPALSHYMQLYSDSDAEPPLILTAELSALAVFLAGLILAGEYFALTGKRFSGKTTLLKLAYALIPQNIVFLASFRAPCGDDLDPHAFLRGILQKEMVLKPDTVSPGERYSLALPERKILIIHIEGIDRGAWEKLLQLNLQSGLLSFNHRISQSLEAGSDGLGVLFFPGVVFVYETSSECITLPNGQDEFYFVQQFSTSTSSFLRKFLYWGMIRRRFRLSDYALLSDFSYSSNEENALEEYFSNSLLSRLHDAICSGPSRDIQNSYTRVSYRNKAPKTHEEALCSLPVTHAELFNILQYLTHLLKRLENIIPISLLSLVWSMLQNSACDDGFLSNSIGASSTPVSQENTCFQFPCVNMLLSTIVRHTGLPVSTIFQAISQLADIGMANITSAETGDPLPRAALLQKAQPSKLCLFHEGWTQGLSLLLKYHDQPIEDFVMDLANDSYYAQHKKTLYMQEDRSTGLTTSYTRVLLPYFSRAGHMLYFKTDLGAHRPASHYTLTASNSFFSDPHLIGGLNSGLGPILSKLRAQSTFDAEKVKSKLPQHLLDKGSILMRRNLRASMTNMSRTCDYLPNDLACPTDQPNRPTTNTGSRVLSSASLYRSRTGIDSDSSDEDSKVQRSFVLDQQNNQKEQTDSVIARLLSRCRAVAQVNAYAIAAIIHIYLAINRAFQSNVLKVAEYLLYTRRGTNRACPQFVQFNPLANPPKMSIINMLVPSGSTCLDHYSQYLQVLRKVGEYVTFDTVEFFEFVCRNTYSPNDGVLKISVEKKVETFKIYESAMMEEMLGSSVQKTDFDTTSRAKKEVTLRNIFQGRVAFANYAIHLARNHRFIVDVNLILQYVQAAAGCVKLASTAHEVYHGNRDTVDEDELSDEDQFVSRVDPRVLRKMPLKPVTSPDGAEFKRNNEVVKTYSGKLSKTDPFFWIFKEQEDQGDGNFVPGYDYRHHRHRYFNKLVSVFLDCHDPQRLAYYVIRSMLLMALGFIPLLGFVDLSYFKRDIYNYRTCYTCELWPYVDMERMQADLEVSDLSELLLTEPCDILLTVAFEHLDRKLISCMPESCPYFSHTELKFLGYLVSFVYGLQHLLSEAELLWLCSRNLAIIVLEDGEVCTTAGSVCYTAFSPRVHTALIEERLSKLHPMLITAYSDAEQPLISLHISPSVKQALSTFSTRTLLLESRIKPVDDQSPISFSESSILYRFLRVLSEKYDTAKALKSGPLPGIFLVAEVAWRLYEHRIETFSNILQACNMVLWGADVLSKNDLAADSKPQTAPSYMHMSTTNTSVMSSSAVSFSMSNARSRPNARKRTFKPKTRDQYTTIQAIHGAVFSINPLLDELKHASVEVADHPESPQVVDAEERTQEYLAAIQQMKSEVECLLPHQLEVCIDMTVRFLCLGKNCFVSPLSSDGARETTLLTPLVKGKRAVSASVAHDMLRQGYCTPRSVPDPYVPSTQLRAADSSREQFSYFNLPESHPTPALLTVFFDTLHINLGEALALVEILLDSQARCLPEELHTRDMRSYAKSLLLAKTTLSVFAAYLISAQVPRIVPLLPPTYSYTVILLLEACQKLALFKDLISRRKDVGINIDTVFNISYINCATRKPAFAKRLDEVLQDDSNQHGAIVLYNCFAQGCQAAEHLLTLISLLSSTTLLQGDIIILDGTTKVRLKYDLTKTRFYFVLARTADHAFLSRLSNIIYPIHTPQHPQQAFAYQVELLKSIGPAQCSPDTLGELFIDLFYYVLHYGTMYDTHPLLSRLLLLEARRDAIKEVMRTATAIRSMLTAAQGNLHPAREQIKDSIYRGANTLLPKVATLRKSILSHQQTKGDALQLIKKISRAHAALFAYFYSLSTDYQQLLSVFTSRFFANWLENMVGLMRLKGLYTSNITLARLDWLVRHAAVYPLQQVARLLPITKVEPVLFVCTTIYCTALEHISTRELAVTKLLIALDHNQLCTIEDIVLRGDKQNPVGYDASQRLFIKGLSLKEEDCAAAASTAKRCKFQSESVSAVWARLSVLYALLPRLVGPWMSHFRKEKLSFVKLASGNTFRLLLGHYLGSENESMRAHAGIEELIQNRIFKADLDPSTTADYWAEGQQSLRNYKKRAKTAPSKKKAASVYARNVSIKPMSIKQPLPKIADDLRSGDDEEDRPETGIIDSPTLQEADKSNLWFRELFLLNYTSKNGSFCPQRQLLLRTDVSANKSAQQHENRPEGLQLLSAIKGLNQELEGCIKSLVLPADMASYSMRALWKAFLLSLVCDRAALSDICGLFLRVFPLYNITDTVKEYYKELSADSTALAGFLCISGGTLSSNLTLIARGHLLPHLCGEEGQPLDVLLQKADSQISAARQNLILWYDELVGVELLLHYSYMCVWKTLFPRLSLSFSKYPSKEMFLIPDSTIVVMCTDPGPQIQHLIALKDELCDMPTASVIICMPSCSRPLVNIAQVASLTDAFCTHVESLTMPDCVLRRYKEYYTLVLALGVRSTNLIKQVRTLPVEHSRMVVSLLLLFSAMNHKTSRISFVAEQIRLGESHGSPVFGPCILHYEYTHFSWLIESLATMHHRWTTLTELRTFLQAYISPEEQDFMENTAEDNAEYERVNRYTLESLVATAAEIMCTLTAEAAREREGRTSALTTPDRPVVSFSNLPLSCRVARDFSQSKKQVACSPLGANYLLEGIFNYQLIKAFERGSVAGRYPLVYSRICVGADSRRQYEEVDTRELFMDSPGTNESSASISIPENHDSFRCTPRASVNDVNELDILCTTTRSSSSGVACYSDRNDSMGSIDADSLSNANYNPRYAHVYETENYVATCMHEIGTCSVDKAETFILSVDSVPFMQSLETIGHAFETFASIARKHNTQEHRFLLNQPIRLTDNSSAYDYSKAMLGLAVRVITTICGAPQALFYDSRIECGNRSDHSKGMTQLLIRHSALAGHVREEELPYAHHLIKDASLMLRALGHSGGCITVHPKIYGPAVLEILAYRRLVFANAHLIPPDNVRTALFAKFPDHIRHRHSIIGEALVVEEREDNDPEYNYVPFCTKLVGMRLYGMLYNALTGSLVDFVASAHGDSSVLDVYAIPLCYEPHEQAQQHTGLAPTEGQSQAALPQFVRVPCPPLPGVHAYFRNETSLDANEPLQRGLHLEME